jgi:hypothetical protein
MSVLLTILSAAFSWRDARAISRHRASAFAIPCGGPWLCHRVLISSIALDERRSFRGLYFCRLSWPLSAARVCAFSWMPLVFCAEAPDAAALLWNAQVGAAQSLFSWSRQSVPLWPLICLQWPQLRRRRQRQRGRLRCQGPRLPPHRQQAWKLAGQ